LVLYTTDQQYGFYLAIIPKRNEMYKPDDQIKEDETGEHVARMGRKEMHAGIGKKT